MIQKVLVLLLLLTFSGLSAASEQPPDSLAVILEQQRELQAGLDADQDYGLTPRQIGMVRKAQKEVFALTEGKASLDQLSIDEKIRLENALERINAEIKGGDHVARGEQEVCWRERKSGTGMKVTRCGTQAERDQVREGARLWMEKPSICQPPGCGN